MFGKDQEGEMGGPSGRMAEMFLASFKAMSPAERLVLIAEMGSPCPLCGYLEEESKPECSMCEPDIYAHHGEDA